MVQVIYIVNPLLQAVLMKVGKKLSATAGNLHVTVAFIQVNTDCWVQNIE